MICYYLGAGASTGITDFSDLETFSASIPMSRDVTESLISFSDRLKKISKIEKIVSSSPFDLLSMRDKLVTIVNNIVSNIGNNTIDAYLKKRYLLSANPDEIRSYKIAISCAFKYWQYNRPSDSRYFDFFTNILSIDEKGYPEMPKGINIISWNYDLQVEDALIEYDIFNPRVPNSLQRFPTNKEAIKKYIQDLFNIFHLNGTCASHFRFDGVNPKDIIHEEFLDKKTVTEDLILQNILSICDVLFNKRPDVEPSISYAWEKKTPYHDYKEYLINATSKTEVLVVIGYSFPFFNRAIDREILKSMVNLNKVYFQTPEKDFNEYSNRFLATIGKSIQIIPITDARQFYIPYEFK